MVLTVSAYKGGVGKSTTAMHAAGVLGTRRPTLLIDRDRHPGALRWYRKGTDWPFEATSMADATPELVRQYRSSGNIVIDTPAAPTPEELIAFGSRSDVVLVPTTPDSMAVEALVDTVRDLRKENARFFVALVIVPPWPSRLGVKARAALLQAGLPVLKTEVPRATAFHHAALAGRLVRDVRDSRANELWNAYTSLVDELIDVTGGTRA
jgi:chromosome partitioning protein